MKKIDSFFCVIFLCSLFLISSTEVLASPDTIHVRAHEAVDMVWFESYDETAYFPLEDKSFHKVWMVATLGCASEKCSDWDYTVNLHILDEEGEEFELGRLITPYAGFMANNAFGFSNDWTHRYTYDVTDFIHLFRDSTTLRAFYSGWSTGFSMTLDFYFIEGTPEREVLGIKNIIHGSHNYSDAETYNTVHTPPVTLTVPEGTVEAKLRYLPSGHGFDNNNFCAEFCPRDYYLSVDGDLVGSGTIWKDDCGLNPLYPQGGTWVYDRANWCPGEAVPLHEFELGNLLTPGSEHTFELNLEEYTWSGDQTPSYTTSYQVVFYGERNISLDAELVEIMAPSTHEDHFRINPICSNPRVKVRNNGSEPIEELLIEYGFPDGFFCTYHWTGQLEFAEETEIELPAPLWREMNSENPYFYTAIIEVNGDADQVTYNNELRSEISIPQVFPDEIVLNFRTNNRFNDFHYGLYRENGETLIDRTPNAPNTLFSDTLQLEPGCYYFEVSDSRGLGLNNWPTNQGNGEISFRRHFGGGLWTNLTTVQRDFGSHSRLNFTVGYSLEDEPERPDCGVAVSTTDLGEATSDLRIYPNPAKDHVYIHVDRTNPLRSIRLIDLSGKVMQSTDSLTGDMYKLRLQDDLRSGFYLIEVTTQSGVTVEPITIFR